MVGRLNQTGQEGDREGEKKTSRKEKGKRELCHSLEVPRVRPSLKNHRHLKTQKLTN